MVSIYDSLPLEILDTLDSMAVGIAHKEKQDPLDIKMKMVKNINNLTQDKAQYLVGNLAILIQHTLDNEAIDKDTIKKEFISFLIGLYY